MKRKKSGSKPKVPRRKQIVTTSSCAEKELLLVVALSGQYDEDANTYLPTTSDELFTDIKEGNDIELSDWCFVNNIIDARKAAERMAKHGDTAYITHIITSTEKKLEKWPGAGC